MMSFAYWVDAVRTGATPPTHFVLAGATQAYGGDPPSWAYWMRSTMPACALVITVLVELAKSQTWQVFPFDASMLTGPAAVIGTVDIAPSRDPVRLPRPFAPVAPNSPPIV